MRDLLPNEVFQVGLMGIGIARTDLRPQTGVSGGFTEADRTMLLAIYDVVVNLK